MTKLIFADPHWSDNPRDRYRHDFVSWMVVQIRKRSASEVFLLGDLTTEKNYHESWLVNRCVDNVYRLALEAPVTILQANHDYTNPDHPFFGFLSHIDNVSWISQPTARGSYLFLPHTRQWEQDWKDLEWRYGYYDCVLAHQTFAGAAVGARTMEGIPLDIFKNQKRVISGDIHNPQKIQLPNGDPRGRPNGGLLHYVGAPYRINFGDDYEPRILMLDDQDKLTSISVPGVRKCLLEVTEAPMPFIKCLDQLAAGQNLTEGDILKVRVHLRRESYDEWPKMKGTVRNWAEDAGFVVDSIHPILEAAAKLTPTRREDSKTDAQLVRTYAKKVGASPDTLTAGLTLLEESDGLTA